METLIKAADGLSEKGLAIVIEFVEFVKNKEKKEQTVDSSKPVRKLGTLSGGLKYMADDFDETPDCFKEYM